MDQFGLERGDKQRHEQVSLHFTVTSLWEWPASLERQLNVDLTEMEQYGIKSL